MTRIGIVPIAAALAACASLPALGCPAGDEGYQRLASPEAEIAYRWEPAELKVGQFFAAEVVACRLPDSAALREIAVDATMPAHGHGMNYRPAAARTAPDRFRFTGLMLHMPGMWRVTFDLFHGDESTRLTHEVRLRP
jgi:hypothetical protein